MAPCPRPCSSCTGCSNRSLFLLFPLCLQDHPSPLGVEFEVGHDFVVAVGMRVRVGRSGGVADRGGGSHFAEAGTGPAVFVLDCFCGGSSGSVVVIIGVDIVVFEGAGYFLDVVSVTKIAEFAGDAFEGRASLLWGGAGE